MADPFFRVHTIGADSPFMTRLRLHIFHRGEDDSDPHDHPWSFRTLPLTPSVEEVTVLSLASWPKPGDVWRVERHGCSNTSAPHATPPDSGGEQAALDGEHAVTRASAHPAKTVSPFRKQAAENDSPSPTGPDGRRIAYKVPSGPGPPEEPACE